MTGDFTKHLSQGPDITFFFLPFRTVFQFVFHAALAIWEGLANVVSYYSSEFLLLCNYCDEKKKHGSRIVNTPISQSRVRVLHVCIYTHNTVIASSQSSVITPASRMAT